MEMHRWDLFKGKARIQGMLRYRGLGAPRQ